MIRLMPRPNTASPSTQRARRCAQSPTRAEPRRGGRRRSGTRRARLLTGLRTTSLVLVSHHPLDRRSARGPAEPRHTPSARWRHVDPHRVPDPLCVVRDRRRPTVPVVPLRAGRLDGGHDRRRHRRGDAVRRRRPHACILALKYRNRRAVAKHLASMMVRRLQLGVPGEGRLFDVVTWAPTSSGRARRRGFDQAELLAREVARQLGVPCRRLLYRVHGQAQTGRTRMERLVGPAFRARPVRSGLRVLVVDDVVTTGATLRCAERALRAAGVEQRPPRRRRGHAQPRRASRRRSPAPGASTWRAPVDGRPGSTPAAGVVASCLGVCEPTNGVRLCALTRTGQDGRSTCPGSPEGAPVGSLPA